MITDEMIDAGLDALSFDPGISDGTRVELVLEAAFKVAHPQCDAELAKTYHDSLLAKNARELEQVRAELAAALAHVTELEQALEEHRQWRDELAEARDQARAHLKAEQDAGAKLMNRFCKAMGTFEGCWDNAVEARLREGSVVGQADHSLKDACDFLRMWPADREQGEQMVRQFLSWRATR